VLELGESRPLGVLARERPSLYTVTVRGANLQDPTLVEYAPLSQTSQGRSPPSASVLAQTRADVAAGEAHRAAFVSKHGSLV
jgi:hypothetical protein